MNVEAGTFKNAVSGFRMTQKQLYSNVLWEISRQSSIFAASFLVQILGRYVKERISVRNIGIMLFAFLSNFHFDFNRVTQGKCLQHFGFKKKNIGIFLSCLSWLSRKNKTNHVRYYGSASSSCCFTLRRIAFPCLWSEGDIKTLCGWRTWSASTSDCALWGPLYLRQTLARLHCPALKSTP